MTALLCIHAAVGERRGLRTKEAPRRAGPPVGRGRAVPDGPDLLDVHEERALAARVKAGDHEARDALVTANLGLVVHAIRGFHCPGMTAEDLRQEGVCGLIRAAELYDPERYETRFGPYAASWIRRYVQRAAGENFSLIRLPRYLVGLHGRCRRVLAQSGLDAAEAGVSHAGDNEASGEAERGDEGERSRGLAELASQLQLSARRLRSVVSAIKTQTGWSIVEEGESSALEESAVDPRRPDQELEKAETATQLRKAIRSLTRLEARVVNCRFGLNGRRPRATRGGVGTVTVTKFCEMSRILGISPVRARKILHRALGKLRENLELTLDEDDPRPGVPGSSLSMS
ncbi:sigma-70 family RNA polymerase sigma factor [Aquisphaera insulae]|uniref:sigma-70 family RNA polymerase sigma factor n=1 Tax=Aquisphaera insulae TaxID=2712864 RepID=UPI0013E9B889|nr:sigma-70 family RNA polymerase sigma factor [Aquisphaera insulae]